MSTAAATQSSSGASVRPDRNLFKLDTNLSHLNTGCSAEEVTSAPSARSGAFARLRLGASGIRRSKSLRSLGRTRSEGTMSVYSDVATIAEPMPPLPTSASELTLAHSLASSGTSIRDESPKSMAKSFMRRSSRLLLKKASKTSLTTRTLDWIDETQVAGNEQESSTGTATLKQSISQPFNFQHISHTAADLDSAGKIGPHCATPSRELKGIRAHDLPGPLSATLPGSRSPDADLRTSKSVDSFKRMNRSSFSTPFPPIVPPPRKSSRRPPPLVVPASRGLGQESPTIPDFLLSGRRTSAGSRTVTPKSPLSISIGADDSPLSMMGIAHAVTTPDESACMLKSELTSLLEDVPEEGDQPVQLPSPASPARRSTRGSVARMVRSGSDPVLPEGDVSTEEIPVRVSRRVSNRVANGIFLDLDWDQDIDYCYDQLEADDVDLDLDQTESLSSDGDMLYMNDRRRSHRISKNGIPLHLRKMSAQAKEHGLGVTFSSAQTDSGADSGSMSLVACGAIESLKQTQGSLPLFTPDMTGDLLTAYSPRSSVSQMSKYPSGSSSHAVSSYSSKRTSGSATIENGSTGSVPDLVSSSKRKSTSTKRSSVRSQSSNYNLETSVVAETTDTVTTSPRKQILKQSGLLEPSRIPLRKRSFSESATKTLTKSINTTASTHTRSTSHIPDPVRPSRPYTLFPPLDRIGAANAKA